MQLEDVALETALSLSNMANTNAIACMFSTQIFVQVVTVSTSIIVLSF